mmetsp:Transcript_5172/g.14608  ORF Transcript_5172/g.14608 Transcript_5172/m.14608 type:complete len:242 (-) Transcript_5172:698-1423(-)
MMYSTSPKERNDLYLSNVTIPCGTLVATASFLRGSSLVHARLPGQASLSRWAAASGSSVSAFEAKYCTRFSVAAYTGCLLHLSATSMSFVLASRMAYSKCSANESPSTYCEPRDWDTYVARGPWEPSPGGAAHATFPPSKATTSSINNRNARDDGAWIVHATTRLPSLASFFTAASTSSAVAASKPVVGSSKSSTGGFETRANAILVRFRSPPEITDTCEDAMCVKPISLSNSSTRCILVE